MSAIFDFSSLINVLLLLICTCTYLRELRPTIFDVTSVGGNPVVGNSNAQDPQQQSQQQQGSGQMTTQQQQQPTTTGNDTGPSDNQSARVMKRDGFLGFLWKLSRIGERLSPYIGAGCALMAFHVLFLK